MIRLVRSLHTRTTRRPDIVVHLSPRPGVVDPTATLPLDSSRSLLEEMARSLRSVRHPFLRPYVRGFAELQWLGYVGYDQTLETIIVVHQGTDIFRM